MNLQQSNLQSIFCNCQGNFAWILSVWILKDWKPCDKKAVWIFGIAVTQNHNHFPNDFLNDIFVQSMFIDGNHKMTNLARFLNQMMLFSNMSYLISKTTGCFEISPNCRPPHPRPFYIIIVQLCNNYAEQKYSLLGGKHKYSKVR